MSSNRRDTRRLLAQPHPDHNSHLALQPHQIAAINNPAITLSELAAADPHPVETIGRPIRLWRTRPELAAELNERLFHAAHAPSFN